MGEEAPSKSAKLVQIIDDTVQILIDDNELMRDDDDCITLFDWEGGERQG
jgi:hypothetical protein